jgi:phospholipid/cholesterol/gamma-HCH transport system substrate-binding protein
MTLLAQDERLARRVGAITLLVIGVTIAGFVFLLDRVAPGSSIRVRVMFRHVAGLRDHAALVVGGQPVGRIEAIVPVPHGAGGTLDGEVGVAVMVAVARDQAWKVPAAAEIFVASRGPLSDKYLEVAPPHGDPGPAIHDGQDLRGVDPPSLDNVLQHTWTSMLTFQLFVATVKPELIALRAQLTALRDNLDAVTAEPAAAGVGALAAEARGLVAAARRTHDVSLGGEAGVAQLRAMLADARQAIAQLRVALDALAPRAAALSADLGGVRDRVAAAAPVARAERTLAAIRGALDRIDPLIARLDELTARIASGEGSIGRLLSDPEFPEDTRDLGKIMKRQPWKILERPHD